MSGTKSQFPQDKTKGERTKDLTSDEIRDLELAGGVEGGMQAGSAGGPGEAEAEDRAKGRDPQSGSRGAVSKASGAPDD